MRIDGRCTALLTGIVALPIIVWAQGNLLAQSPPSPGIEAKAMTLLERNQRTMLALKTYTAECRTVLSRDKPAANNHARTYMFSTMKAAKPNKIRYDAWEITYNPETKGWAKPNGRATYTFACDGKSEWKQFDAIYRKGSRTSPQDMGTILEPWRGFYTANDSPYGSTVAYKKSNELHEVRLMGREVVEGVPCDKIYIDIITSYNGEKYEEKATWYIGADSLVHRCVSHVAFGDKPGMTRDSILHGIQLNMAANSALYGYTPPPGVQLQADRTPSALLANGTVAPDFTATDIRKRPVKLSSYRGKVVVVDFWASWCGPCMASMPHNQEVMKKLRAQGLPVVLLAVDDGEPREAFDAWVKEKSASLSALTFVHSPSSNAVSSRLFRVTAIPAQFVLDKRGVVRASFAGYGGPTDALEQAVRSVVSSH